MDGLRQAEEHLVAGQYEAAVRAFGELLPQIAESDPGRVQVLFGLGRAYFGREGLREGRFAGPDAYREDQRNAHDALREALEQTQTVACRDQLMGMIHYSLGTVLRREGNFRGAVEHLGNAERIFQKAGLEQERGSALSVLILALLDAGDFSAVGPRCKELEALPQKKRDPHTRGTLGMADLALGNLSAARLKFDVARSLADQDPIFRDDFRLKAELAINLAAHSQVIGKYDDALQILARISRQATERVVDRRTTAMISANLGRIFLTLERLDEAEEALDDALGVLSELLGNKHPDTLYLILDQAKLARLRVDLVGARGKCENAIAWATAALGEAHPLIADARLALAKVLVAEKRCSEAMTQAEKATRLRDQIHGPNHLRSVKVCLEAMLLAADCRETEAGRVFFRKLRPQASARFERLAEALGPNHLEILMMEALFADVSALTPETYEEASRRYQTAEEGLVRVLGDGVLTVAQLRFKQGKLLEMRDRPDDALAKHRHSLRRLHRRHENHPVRADLLAAIGDLLKSKNQRTEAIGYFRQAYRIMERRYGVDHQKVKEFAAAHGGN